MSSVAGGIPYADGEDMRGDDVTARKVCELTGWVPTMQGYTTARYSSPGNNTVIHWNGSQFIRQNAGGFNSYISTLTCVKVAAQCEDGQDNDGDGVVDMDDPGCSSPQDSNEFDGPIMGIGIDAPATVGLNETFAFDVKLGNGGNATAFNANSYHFFDAGSSGHPWHGNPVPSPFNFISVTGSNCAIMATNPNAILCSLGNLGVNEQRNVAITYKVPNDTALCGRTFTYRTEAHPGTQTRAGDKLNSGSNKTTRNITVTCAAPVECNDGADNDGDGYIDHPRDPGCTSPDDNDESNPTTNNCNAADARIQCVVRELTNATGKPVYPDRTQVQGDGTHLLFWNGGDETIARAVFLQSLERCGLQPLKPTNFTDNNLELAVKNVTSNPQSVVVFGACNLHADQYRNAGHKTSRDLDCNESYLVYEVNNPDSTLNGIRDKGENVPNQAEAAICIPEGTPKPQCSDGKDNDGDGKIDMQDPGCSNPNDNNEGDDPQCSDGKDNDGDGRIDIQDPGCHNDNDPNDGDNSYNPNDNNEGDEPECSDAKDNDGDGKVDLQDPGCSGPTDDDEDDEPQCSDGKDNDGDGKVDMQDPGCTNPDDDDESDPECRDGIDNDGDGATDFPDDFSCTSPNDDDETHPKAQCQDGIDNDGDGKIDFPQDPGCTSKQDNDESNGAQNTTLTIDKVTQQSTVNRGEAIFYTLVVRNTGNAVAQNVEVIDNVPFGLTYQPAGSTQGCTLHTVNNVQQVQCAPFNLNPGETRSFTLKFMVNNDAQCGGVIRNQGDVDADNAQLEWDDVFSTVQCASSSSSSSTQKPECSDGVDNDGDNLIDFQDPGCYTNGIYDPNDDSEFNASSSSSSSSSAPKAQCSDGVDNDGDNLIDFQDPGCYTNGIYNPNDDSEFNASSSSSSSTQTQQPDLIIQKTGPSTVSQGGQIVYTITVTNLGNGNADQVVVNDTIPGGTHFISSTGASCTQNTATNVACTLGTIHGGQNRTFTLTFQTFQGIACNSSVINQAMVSTTSNESNTGNNFSQAVSTTVQCASSSSSSSIGTGCVEVTKLAFDPNGNQLFTVPQFTFTLDGSRTAVNNSNGYARFDNVSTGVHTVIESVPAGWSLQSVNPNNGTVTVNNGSSCAQVVFSNRQNAVNSQNFSIDITDGESEVDAGDDLTYAITVRNLSNQTVNGVTVTATMDDEVDVDDVSDNGVRNGRTITWLNLNFGPNETKTLRVDVEVDDDADDEIKAYAQVFNVSDTDRTDVEDVDSDEDDDDASVQLTKDSSTAEVFPGGIIEYTLRLRNTGDVDVRDITVEDRLPYGVTVIDRGGADQSGNTLEWEIDRLDENDTWTVRYRVSVNAGITPGTILRNDVRIRGGGVNESESVTVSVIGNLPQTGFQNGSPLRLSPIHRGVSGNPSVPLAVWLSLMGVGTGAGLGFGRRYLFGL